MFVGVQITLQWESSLGVSGNEGENKYQDLLVNIKKHHCFESVTAKLKRWNHTCLFQPYRSVYKMMWSNEFRLREYVKPFKLIEHPVSVETYIRKLLKNEFLSRY